MRQRPEDQIARVQYRKEIAYLKEKILPEVKKEVERVKNDCESRLELVIGESDLNKEVPQLPGASSVGVPFPDACYSCTQKCGRVKFTYTLEDCHKIFCKKCYDSESNGHDITHELLVSRSPNPVTNALSEQVRGNEPVVPIKNFCHYRFEPISKKWKIGVEWEGFTKVHYEDEDKLRQEVPDLVDEYLRRLGKRKKAKGSKSTWFHMRADSVYAKVTSSEEEE